MKINPWRAIPTTLGILLILAVITLLEAWALVGWLLLLGTVALILASVGDWWETQSKKWDRRHKIPCPYVQDGIHRPYESGEEKCAFCGTVMLKGRKEGKHE